MKIGTFHTPPENQGQIVIVSYTMIDSTVIRKIYDRRDRSTVYAISEALESDEGDYWNGAPDNYDWMPISATELNRQFAEDWEVGF